GPTARGPRSPRAQAAPASARPCTLMIASMAKKHRTACCSVRSNKSAPQIDRALSPIQLALQGHLLLGAGIRWEFLVAGRIAVVAQDERHQVRIGLRGQLAWSVRGHGHAEHAEQNGGVSRSPAPAEKAALQRRSAELA